MIASYNAQTGTYGGVLGFNPTVTIPFAVTIPLFLKQADLPIRKPKITEINTIPVEDEVHQSDWSTHALFMGGQEPLTTTVQGYFMTPTTTVVDAITSQVYRQLNPTDNGTSTGISLGLTGYSYGDVIWGYIEGKLNQMSPSLFRRTDPAYYIDPFGNQYNSVVIQQFQSEYSVTTQMQPFNMTMRLEV